MVVSSPVFPVTISSHEASKTGFLSPRVATFAASLRELPQHPSDLLFLSPASPPLATSFFWFACHNRLACRKPSSWLTHFLHVWSLSKGITLWCFSFAILGLSLFDCSILFLKWTARLLEMRFVCLPYAIAWVACGRNSQFKYGRKWPLGYSPIIW